MEDKYRVIREHIEEMGLGSAAVAHYKDMFERYEKIFAENDTEIEQGELNSVMNDMDSFIEEFIERKKVEIEAKITKFRVHFNEVNEIINNIKAQLILENDLIFEDIVKEVDDNLKDLIDEANELIAIMDGFKKIVSGYDSVKFSMNYKDVKKAISLLKIRIREIKRHQVEVYNSTVLMINNDILAIKKIEGLSEELISKINGLVELTVVNVTVRNWNDIKYLNELNFIKLKQILALIAEIKKEITEELKIEFVDAVVADIEADMSWIETKINNLESMLKDEMTAEEILKLEQEIVSLSNRIVELNVKLKENKDKFNVDKYNEYLSRISDAEANITDLALELNKKKVNQNVFDRIKNSLNSLEQEIVDFKFIVDSLYGKVLADAALVYEGKLDLFEGRLQEIKNTIEEEHKNGKLDVNQYNQLNKIVEDVEKKINETREKVKNPEMFRDVDVFLFLNGQIDGLEKAVTILEERINLLEKPIKDRKVRKEIDKQFKAIEKEIKNLEKDLEKYKEQDAEKYEATKERLNNVKDRLDKVGKQYRKKCPLLVRAIKSAKAFYKKHKKICLTIAGLAAFSLVSYHVLIPAIIHGNIMLGSTVPALSGFTGFVNNILGGVIGATKTSSGLWYLSNGMILNPDIASVSLLKGLAISGIGTAALVTPLIMGVKKVSHKMNLSELRNRLRRNKPEEENKPRNKISARKADRMSIEELSKLLKEYRKSGMSLDEFALKHELSNEDKIIIQYLDDKSQENIINVGRSK